MLDESLDEEVDKKRSVTVFKSQITSFQILCFYKLFITEVCEKRKSREELLSQYEGNLAKLSNKEEENLQKNVVGIFSKVTSFDELFKYLGIKNRP